MPRERSRYRDRRSASYSSESSYDKKKKSKSKKRSRSRDRSVSSSVKRRRSSSRTRHRRKSYSRSVSRERYDKSRRRSLSKSRSRRDRSRSRSRSKYSKSSKKSKRSRSSSSRSSSFDIEPAIPKKVNLDDIETKVEKAIKAAEAVGLTMTKLPSYEYKEVEVKEDMPTILDRNLLAELNSDSFVQKSFKSSKSKKNILIDLKAETILVPDSEVKVQKDETIINFNELPSEEELREMWINKLYLYRKKMLKGEGVDVQ